MDRLLHFLDRELYAKQLWKTLHAWIPLTPLAGVGFVIIASRAGWDSILSKSLHETIAIYLVGLGLLLAAFRLWSTRAPFYGIMTFLVAALLFREIHLPHTGNLVYANVVIAFVWMYLWRKKIEPEITRPWILNTFAGMWSCYILALLIARRVFGFIPGENALHIPLEEFLETMGHIFLVLIFLINPTKSPPDPSLPNKNISPPSPLSR